MVPLYILGPTQPFGVGKSFFLSSTLPGIAPTGKPLATFGRIQEASTVILTRKEEEVGKAKIVSMRREKETIKEAKEGEECGIITNPQLDFEIGDVLVSVRK